MGAVTIRDSEVVAHRRNTIRLCAPSLPTEKLERLVNGSDNPVVGPKTALALGEFANLPEPPFATEGDIGEMVAMLSMGKPKRPMTDEEAKANLIQYKQILTGARKADLDAAYEELLRTKTFMPTVAEVYECVKGFEARRRFRKSRARHLVALHEREWAPPIEKMTAEDLAEVMQDIERLAEKMRGIDGQSD